MKSIVQVNQSLCFALGIDPHMVSKIEVEYTADNFPLVKIHRMIFGDLKESLEQIKESAEFQEILTDQRKIVLVDEMAEFFQEKLLETKSFDDAFTKAIWRAYLAGIKVGLAEVNQEALPFENLG